MSKASANRDAAARSYDKSVSNRAQKPKQPRPPQGSGTAQQGRPSKPATDATTTQQPSEDTAKAKDVSSDRRTVFKSTLDTPFRVEWPSIPPSVVASFLNTFVQLLEKEQVAEYQAARGRRPARARDAGHPAPADTQPRKKKRKRSEKAAQGAVDDGASPAPREHKRRRVQEGEAVADPIPPPAVLSHVVLGINHVTKRLEGQLEALTSAKRAVIGNAPSAQSQPPALKYVLVCTGDIDPGALVAHIPHLVAGCNSNAITDVVVLVPLPKGSEAQLARAFGLPRASVVGIASSAPPSVLDPFVAVSESIPIVRAPWLVVPAPPSRDPDAMKVETAPAKEVVELIPTHVKQLRTSAPRNMGAAKRARKEARAAVRVKLVSQRHAAGGGKPLKKPRVVVVSLPESTT